MWKNKIVGHAEIPPGDLVAHPHNWRLHPQHQKDALTGVIGDIGFIKSITVNRTSGRIIDGHLRVTLAIRDKIETIPVEYVDLNEHEEAEALSTMDPIAALAEADAQNLDAVLSEVQTGDVALQEMLSDLAKSAGLYVEIPEDSPEFDETIEEEVKFNECPNCGHKWPK